MSVVVFQFSIRHVMLLTVIVALCMAGWIQYRRVEERRREDALIEASLALFRERLSLQEEQKGRKPFSAKRIAEAGRALRERGQSEQG